MGSQKLTFLIHRGKVNPIRRGLAHRRSRVIALLFPSLTAALEADEWSASRPGRSLPRESFGTHFTGGWMDPSAGLECRENFVLAVIRFADFPTGSHSLYQLNYQAHITQWIAVNYNHYTLSNNPVERSCQETGVVLTVTDIGAPCNPLLLNSTAPLTQTLGFTLQWIAHFFNFMYIFLI